MPEKAKVLSVAASRFSSFPLPLEALYQSLGAGFDVTAFDFACLLSSWETLKAIAWQLNETSSHSWVNPETRHFASPDVFELLGGLRSYGALAVDDGVALYVPPGFSTLGNVELLPEPNVPTNVPDVLVDPAPRQVMELLGTQDEAIASYLESRTAAGTDGHFETKVGVSRIDIPLARFNLPLTLHVRPVSYWSIREFNRRMLLGGDDRLLRMRAESLREILQPADSIAVPCPNGLFLEVALITKDQKLVVLEKSPARSALARQGYSWTCTLEEGLVWHKDVTDKVFDARRTLLRALRNELSLDSDAVETFRLLGLAVETTHLNIALLGVVQLSVDSSLLIHKIQQSEDFGARFRFVDLASAFSELFSEPSNFPAAWHPLARMRILLAMYNLSGRNLVWQHRGPLD